MAKELVDNPTLSRRARSIRLLSVLAAAEFLSISRSKIYDLIYRGALPSVLIGRARRIDLEDLEAFIIRSKKGGNHGKKPAKGNLSAKGREEFMDQLLWEAGIDGKPAA